MIARIAEGVGKGLFAGVAGTAAMTIVSTLEMKARGREASTTPVDAVSKVFDIKPVDEAARMRLSNITHWAYGTTWGAVRGVIGASGMRGISASAAHFAAVWGAALVMLPALKVAPPPTEWGAKELMLDALHHAVYAAAAGVVYDALDPPQSSSRCRRYRRR